jgi:hypothetical protein
MAHLPVTMLTGVLDPPPGTLAYPWAYLSGVMIGAVLATMVAAQLVLQSASHSAREGLRGA